MLVLLPLLLLLLMMPIFGMGCPKECICNQASVDCSGAYLWDIPSNIPTEIISLDLAYNNLTILPDAAFQTLPSLVTLLIHSSAVETVEPDAFRGLSVLGFLDLHNNHISHLHPGLFRHNPALSTLNLSGNRMHTIIEGIFSKNPVLSRIFLTGNPLETTVNWLVLGSHNFLSLGQEFCETSYSTNLMFLTSNVFNSIDLDRKEFKAIGVTNVIVYQLNNMTWAVLETPTIFPILCLCIDLSIWVLCGQEISSRTTCTTPFTIHESFIGTKCEYLNAAKGFINEQTTEEELPSDTTTASQDMPSTTEALDHKPYLPVDRNLLVIALAVAGVLVIMWIVAYLVFFHGKRKKRQTDTLSEVSTTLPPGGSPMSLPENVAYNPVAVTRYSATPDMLQAVAESRAINRSHILYSSLNPIDAMSNLEAQNVYSEVQDRMDEFDKQY